MVSQTDRMYYAGSVLPITETIYNERRSCLLFDTYNKAIISANLSNIKPVDSHCDKHVRIRIVEAIAEYRMKSMKANRVWLTLIIILYINDFLKWSSFY